jgi:hypothetical protein
MTTTIEAQTADLLHALAQPACSCDPKARIAHSPAHGWTQYPPEVCRAAGVEGPLPMVFVCNLCGGVARK